MKTLNKKQKIVFAFLFILLVVISCDKDAFEHLDNASKFFNLGMYDQAIVELRTSNRFLKDDKYFQESMYRYLMWGIIALKEGDQPKAVENFKLALEKDPGEIQVRLILSTLYVQQRAFNKAADLFTDKKHLDVTYGCTDYIEGINQYYKGNIKTSIKSFENALAVLNEEYISFFDNDSQKIVVEQMRLVIYSMLGEAYLQQGDFTNSVKYFAKALEIDKQNNILDAKLKIAMLRHQLIKDPKNSGLYATIGYYYSLLQLNHQSINYYQKAVGLSPNSAPAYLGLAMAYKSILNYSQAEKCLQKAIINSHNAKMIAAAYLELGELFIEYNRINEAYELFNKASVLDPENLPVKDNLNHAQLLLEYKKNNGNYKVNILLGDSFMQRMNYEEALRHYHFAEISNPSAEALNGKGRVYFLQNNYKYSIEQYKNSLKLDPENTQALFGLSDNFMAIEQYEQAVNLVRKVLEKDKDNVLLHNKLAYIYFYSGQSNNAVKEWQYVLDHINNDQMAEVIQKIIEVIG